MDLSNLTFNLTGGNVTLADERTDVSKSFTVINYPLTELSNQLNVSESLDGWDNSLVKITSQEVDLYRYLNGRYDAKMKCEVNLMTKSGNLAYTFKNTYNSGVTCTLYKLPASYITVVLPKFKGAVTKWAFNITRSKVNVYGVVDNNISVPVDRSILSSGDTYGVNWHVNMSGVPQPDNNSRYSILMEYTLKHSFLGCTCGSGWRFADGNYCRDVVLRDSVVHSFHLHYGSSGVLVDNSTVKEGVLVGTGAFDEQTRIINSNIMSFGVRIDYGEHKGDIIVKGGSIRVPEGKTGIVDLILCRSDNVLSSGNPVQPRALHLPRKIIVESEIHWPDAVTLNIVSYKNNFKTSVSPILRDFVMPSLIDFTGSVFHGKNARYEYALSYHDATTREVPIVKLTPAYSKGCKVEAYIGYRNEYASCIIGFECNMDIEYKNIVSFNTRSYIKNKGGIVRRFAGYSGGTPYAQGRVGFNETILDWDTGNNLVAGLLLVESCFIDGTRAKGDGSKPVVNAYVHRAANNICYNIVSTDTREVVDKKYRLCSREGEAANFSTGEVIVPEWL